MAEKSKNGFSWYFVPINFVKKDRDAIGKIEPDATQIISQLGTLAQVGYKVTVSFDPKTDCYVLSITGKQSGSADDGKTFTIYHSQLDRLWCGFLYVVQQGASADSLSRLYDVKYANDW